MSLEIQKFEVQGPLLITLKSYGDERGFFVERFNEKTFKEALSPFEFPLHFVQDNFSHSVNGVIRGLHFQKAPKAQAKLVTVLKGKIFDVAVDIRKNSPTYGKWVSEILSGNTHNLLYVPEGFAHGFCVISDDADVLYKVSNEYSQEHERSIIWNDPKLDIQWPIKKPIISNKDNKLSLLENLDNDFVYRDTS